MNKENTYATAESITGGRLQAHFTCENGSSNFFLGGVTAYSTDVKVNLLGVDKDVALKNNSVCEQTAIEMAIGCFKMFRADYSIATTGYVQGFVFDSKRFEPEMHVAIFCSKTDRVYHKHVKLPIMSDRDANLKKATSIALSFLDSVLLNESKKGKV